MTMQLFVIKVVTADDDDIEKEAQKLIEEMGNKGYMPTSVGCGSHYSNTLIILFKRVQRVSGIDSSKL